MSVICPSCGAEVGLIAVAKKPMKGDTSYEGVQRKLEQAGAQMS